jgi:hypothetical protein
VVSLPRTSPRSNHAAKQTRSLLAWLCWELQPNKQLLHLLGLPSGTQAPGNKHALIGWLRVRSISVAVAAFCAREHQPSQAREKRISFLFQKSLLFLLQLSRKSAFPPSTLKSDKPPPSTFQTVHFISPKRFRRRFYCSKRWFRYSTYVFVFSFFIYFG